MPKPVGSPKTGGRKKGTPNRRTLDFQTCLDDQGIDLIAEIKNLLPVLSPDQKASVILDLLAYLYPKRKAVEPVIESSENGPQIVVMLPSNGFEAPV